LRLLHLSADLFSYLQLRSVLLRSRRVVQSVASIDVKTSPGMEILTREGEEPYRKCPREGFGVRAIGRSLPIGVSFRLVVDPAEVRH
jgi:hypothetical protein